MDTPKIVSAFMTDGLVIQCRPYGNGHINLTLLLTTDTDRQYILQRINSAVFSRPEELMENIIAVTRFLQKVDPQENHSLHFLPARDGRYFAVDPQGEYWRCYDFVPGISLDAPQTDTDLYQSALAFGTFQRQLADFPAATLHDILPNFHNTPDRYRRFRASVEADRAGRAASVEAEIQYLLQQEKVASQIQSALETNELPLRVTHNDTKLNNVLLDEQTRQALCVLDLDTVMSGSSLFDFGDSIRFGAATAAEDTPDASSMGLDLCRFEAYARGYLAASDLTETEKRMLPLGALTMTLEVAVRFLTDYLDGDVYFRIAYPQHNLIRARSQIALAKDMQAKMTQMQKIIASIA